MHFRVCFFKVKVQNWDTRYKKLYLKSAFNFNISNISHQGYFTDKQSERLYKYKHISNHRKFGLISHIFI